MADDTDTDWLALADFLDAHANDMRAWTEDEPKFRATAEGLRQLAAITAERDAAVARAAQLGTGIDSVRSHWHADEGPRWTANVIEALRHSGLMDDVMLSGTPDPDTDPNTLAEYFVEWADSVDPLWQGGFCSDNDALRERAMNARAAADGLRRLDAIDRTWDGYTLQPKDVTDRVERTRLLARGQIAASLSPTPTPKEPT